MAVSYGVRERVAEIGVVLGKQHGVGHDVANAANVEPLRRGRLAGRHHAGGSELVFAVLGRVDQGDPRGVDRGGGGAAREARA